MKRLAIAIAVVLCGCVQMQKTTLTDVSLGVDQVRARSLTVVDLTKPYDEFQWPLPGWRRVQERDFDPRPSAVLKSQIERSLAEDAASDDVEVWIVELAFFEEVPRAILIPLVNNFWENMDRDFKCQAQIAVKKQRRSERFVVEYVVPFTSKGLQGGDSSYKASSRNCWPGLVSQTIRTINDFRRSD